MRSHFKLVSFLISGRKKNPQTFRNPDSEGSVKHSIFPTYSRQAAFAVLGMADTTVSAAALAL